MSDPLVSKSDFVGIEDVAHLAVGGEAPFLRSHLQVVETFAREKSRGAAGRERIVETSEETRRTVAALLRVEAEEIGFAYNVAHGVNMVALSGFVQPGDNVVVEQWEFPSALFPFLALRQRDVEVRVLPGRATGWRGSVDALSALVDERTKVMAISDVSYFTGERHDIAALADVVHDVGGVLVVDTSHSFGALDLDVRDVDFMFSCCYKWILGVHGVAVAYWNRRRLPDWRPLELGWRSTPWQSAQERGGDLRHVDHAGVFELGNPGFLAVALLGNATSYISRVGIEQVQHRVLQLSGELHKGLTELGVHLLTPPGDSSRSGNVAFEVSDEAAWQAGLERRGVHAWTSDSRVRFSTHFYNDLSDVAAALDAVEAVAAEVGVIGSTQVPAPTPR